MADVEIQEPQESEQHSAEPQQPGEEEQPRAEAEQPRAEAEQPGAEAEQPRSEIKESTATGRRKESVARVRLVAGSGQFRLNGRSLEEYFPTRTQRVLVTAPLRRAGREKEIDVIATLEGGGATGQAGALQHGIARALVVMDVSLRTTLKRDGFLTRDPREKERRKYGLKKARKAPQYSKR